MANEAKTLDVTRPIQELLCGNDDLKGLLTEMGIDAADLPGSEPLVDYVKELGVDPSVVVMALGAMGYDVQGYVAEPNPAADSTLSDIMSVIFLNKFRGEDLPDTVSSSNGEAGPMLAHMEMAVRRAQAEGKLPKQGE